MRLLLVSATELEIQDTIKFLSERSEHSKFSYHILITGVGAIAVTYSLAKKISAFQPDLVIQAGIAGSFNQNLITKVVAVEKEFIGDLGVYENNEFRDVFDMSLAQPSVLPFKEKALINESVQRWNKTALPLVNSVSISEITTSTERIDSLTNKYNANIESMEGAAFHYVCLQEKKEFIQIRSVSNLIGVRDKSQWKMREAISNLNLALQTFLQKLI